MPAAEPRPRAEAALPRAAARAGRAAARLVLRPRRGGAVAARLGGRRAGTASGARSSRSRCTPGPRRALLVGLRGEVGGRVRGLDAAPVALLAAGARAAGRGRARLRAARSRSGSARRGRSPPGCWRAPRRWRCRPGGRGGRRSRGRRAGGRRSGSGSPRRPRSCRACRATARRSRPRGRAASPPEDATRCRARSRLPVHRSARASLKAVRLARRACRAAMRRASLLAAAPAFASTLASTWLIGRSSARGRCGRGRPSGRRWRPPSSSSGDNRRPDERRLRRRRRRHARAPTRASRRSSASWARSTPGRPVALRAAARATTPRCSRSRRTSASPSARTASARSSIVAEQTGPLRHGRHRLRRDERQRRRLRRRRADRAGRLPRRRAGRPGRLRADRARASRRAPRTPASRSPAASSRCCPSSIRGHPSPDGFDLVGTCFGTVALDAIVTGAARRPGDARDRPALERHALQRLHARAPRAARGRRPGPRRRARRSSAAPRSPTRCSSRP